MTLLEEFRGMKKLPIIEINLREYDESLMDDDYRVFNIQADKQGLYTIGQSGLVVIEWDAIFSLDEHLQDLFDEIIKGIK